MEEPIFASPAPPDPNTVPHGVEYRGLWERAHDGTAIAARRMVNAMGDAGVPVHLCRSEFGPDSEVDPEAAIEMGGTAVPLKVGEGYSVTLRGAPSRHIRAVDLTIHHRLLRVPHLRSVLYPGEMGRRSPEECEPLHPFMFLLTVFERDRITTDEAAMLKRFGEVWIPCKRFVQVARDHGVTNAQWMPHPWPTYPLSKAHFDGVAESRPALVPPDQPVVFGHLGKWEPRKGHHELVGAFLMAFKHGTPALLLLKTSPFGAFGNYPASLTQSIITWMDDPRVAENGWTLERAAAVIKANTKPYKPAQMLDFYARTNVYVTASHGEAFDLPAFDAVLAGCRLVHVGYGGSEDFAPRNAIRVWDGESLERAHPGYTLGDARWAAIDMDRLVAGLRQAFAERTHGGLCPNIDDYSPSRIGHLARDRMRSYLLSLGREVTWLWPPRSATASCWPRAGAWTNSTPSNSTPSKPSTAPRSSTSAHGGSGRRRKG